MRLAFANIGLLAWGDQGWGDELFRGTLVTLQLAACALVLGLTLGLLLAGAKLSSNAALRWAGELYMAFIRATPEFLILLLFYYGSERAVQALLTLIAEPGQIAHPVELRDRALGVQ